MMTLNKQLEEELEKTQSEIKKWKQNHRETVVEQSHEQTPLSLIELERVLKEYLSSKEAAAANREEEAEAAAKREAEAAANIQAVARGNKVRRDAKREAAAPRIQAGVRGRLARAAAKREAEAAANIQAGVRERQERVKAAKRIQAGARERQERVKAAQAPEGAADAAASKKENEPAPTTPLPPPPIGGAPPPIGGAPPPPPVASTGINIKKSPVTRDKPLVRMSEGVLSNATEVHYREGMPEQPETEAFKLSSLKRLVAEKQIIKSISSEYLQQDLVYRGNMDPIPTNIDAKKSEAEKIIKLEKDGTDIEFLDKSSFQDLQAHLKKVSNPYPPIAHIQKQINTHERAMKERDMDKEEKEKIYQDIRRLSVEKEEVSAKLKNSKIRYVAIEGSDKIYAIPENLLMKYKKSLKNVLIQTKHLKKNTEEENKLTYTIDQMVEGLIKYVEREEKEDISNLNKSTEHVVKSMKKVAYEICAEEMKHEGMANKLLDEAKNPIKELNKLISIITEADEKLFKDKTLLLKGLEKRRTQLKRDYPAIYEEVLDEQWYENQLNFRLAIQGAFQNETPHKKLSQTCKDECAKAFMQYLGIENNSVKMNEIKEKISRLKAVIADQDTLIKLFDEEKPIKDDAYFEKLANELIRGGQNNKILTANSTLNRFSTTLFTKQEDIDEVLKTALSIALKPKQTKKIEVKSALMAELKSRATSKEEEATDDDVDSAIRECFATIDEETERYAKKNGQSSATMNIIPYIDTNFTNFGLSQNKKWTEYKAMKQNKSSVQSTDEDPYRKLFWPFKQTLSRYKQTLSSFTETKTDESKPPEEALGSPLKVGKETPADTLFNLPEEVRATEEVRTTEGDLQQKFKQATSILHTEEKPRATLGATQKATMPVVVMPEEAGLPPEELTTERVLKLIAYCEAKILFEGGDLDEEPKEPKELESLKECFVNMEAPVVYIKEAVNKYCKDHEMTEDEQSEDEQSEILREMSQYLLGKKYIDVKTAEELTNTGSNMGFRR